MRIRINADTTEEEIKESTDRVMNSGVVATDLTDYYAEKLFGLSMGEVRRQCEATLE